MLNFSEFAKLIGVSRQLVGYAAKKGKFKFRIVKGAKMVEPVSAQKEWNANKDRAASSRNLSGKKKPTKTKVVVAVSEAPTFQGMTTADADRKDKVYKAKLSELKYLEQAGELIKAADVKRQAFELARQTRDAVMTIPARIAHEVAAETEPRKVEIMLNREFVKALEKLTEGTK